MNKRLIIAALVHGFVCTIAYAATTATATAGSSSGIKFEGRTTTYSDGTNIRQQSTVSYPANRSGSASYIGTATTSVNNGYTLGGEGGAQQGNSRGSTSDTTIGIGIRKTFP